MYPLKLGGCEFDSSIIRSELGGIVEAKTGSPLILMRGLNSFVLLEKLGSHFVNIRHKKVFSNGRLIS